MNSSETYTLTDIARECGVSRQAVYKRLQVDSELSQAVDRLTVQVDRRKVYTVDALEVLKRAFNSGDSKSVNVVDISVYSREVDRLTLEVDELNAKCKQLTQEVDTATQQIDRLTKERDKAISELENAKTSHTAELDRLNAMANKLDEARTVEIDALKAQILTLQSQVDILNAALADAQQLTKNAQTLQLAAMHPPAQIGQKPPNFWQRIFGKRTPKHDFDIDDQPPDSSG